MQFLSLIFILWIFTGTAHSETDISSQNVDLNLFDDASYEPINKEISFEDTSSFGSLTESESNWLPSLDPATGINPTSSLDIVDWDLMPESDSMFSLPDADLTSPLPDTNLASLFSFTDPTSLLRDSIWDQINSPVADESHGCEVSNAVDVPLFGKTRRGATCTDRDSENTPYCRQTVPRDTVTDSFAYAFPERLDVCPPEIFLKSNIPVCKEGSPSDLDSFFVVGQSWMHLYGVNPRTSAHALDKHFLNLLNIPPKPFYSHFQRFAQLDKRFGVANLCNNVGE